MQLENPYKTIVNDPSVESIRSLIHQDALTERKENEIEGELKPREKLQKPESITVCLFSILSFLNPQDKETDMQISWKASIQFYENIRSLACSDSSLLLPFLDSVMDKLCDLCNSLQSAVTKGALITLSDLVFFLGVLFYFILFYIIRQTVVFNVILFSQL